MFKDIPLNKFEDLSRNILLKSNKFMSFIRNKASASFIHLSSLHTQHGAGTHSPEIESPMLYWLSRPGVPGFHFALHTKSYVEQRCNLDFSYMQ